MSYQKTVITTKYFPTVQIKQIFAEKILSSKKMSTWTEPLKIAKWNVNIIDLKTIPIH